MPTQLAAALLFGLLIPLIALPVAAQDGQHRATMLCLAEPR